MHELQSDEWSKSFDVVNGDLPEGSYQIRKDIHAPQSSPIQGLSSTIISTRGTTGPEVHCSTIVQAAYKLLCDRRTLERVLQNPGDYSREYTMNQAKLETAEKQMRWANLKQRERRAKDAASGQNISIDRMTRSLSKDMTYSTSTTNTNHMSPGTYYVRLDLAKGGQLLPPSMEPDNNDHDMYMSTQGQTDSKYFATATLLSIMPVMSVSCRGMCS